MRVVKLISVFILFNLYAFATLQEPDYVYYKRMLLLIDNHGLGEENGNYFPLSVCKYQINWPKRTKGYSTGNVKGYYATWEIRNDSLFLIKVQNDDYVDIPLKILFPENQTKNGLFANWYNGSFEARTRDSFLSSNKEVNDRGLRLFASFKNGIIKEKFEPTKTN